jgi:uncharacterized protein YcbK (DUF882 family)
MNIVVLLLDQIQKGEVSAHLLLNNVKETATLTFQQESEFRAVDLLQINLQESDVEMIKSAISFRISAQSQLNMLVQERLKDITNIIEQKNPTLLKEIKRGLEVGQTTLSAGQKIDIN